MSCIKIRYIIIIIIIENCLPGWHEYFTAALDKCLLKCVTYFPGNTALLADNKQQIGLVGMLIGVGEITGTASTIFQQYYKTNSFLNHISPVLNFLAIGGFDFL